MLDTKELKKVINNGNMSSQKSQARVGVRYYKAHHDIENLRLFYYDAEGNIKEDKNRSNIKISHPFFTELVDQEAQYLLSGDAPIVSYPDATVQGELDRLINNNDEFRSELNEVVTGAIIKGCEYLYMYMGEDEQLHVQRADSLGVIELSAKHASDDVAHVIYTYTTEERTKDGDFVTVTKVQDWTDKDVTYYSGKGLDDLELDSDYDLNPRPHIVYRSENGTARGKSLGAIPFIRLDYNEERIGGLERVKDLIDDYDLMSCGLSNNIQDGSEMYWVVKGFAGDDLDELIHNIKTKKQVGITEDGGIDIRTMNIPTEARIAKMAQDERNIYRFGFGFDSELMGGSAMTATEIKSRYSRLDMKANKLEMQLRPFIAQVVRFISSWIALPPVEEMQIAFERNIIVNEIDNAALEKTNAERKGVEVTTLLATMDVLGADIVVPELCKHLGLDYEDIKGLIPTREAPIEALDV